MTGYLAPDGTFYKCPAYMHLNVAIDLVYKLTGQKMIGIDAEEKLFYLGYVGLFAKGATFRFFQYGKSRTLTDEQREFLEIHLIDITDKEQKRRVLNLLHMNIDLMEGSVLSVAEDKT